MQEELVKNAVEGDIEAFEKLITLCHKKAYNQAYRMMGNAEDAADLSQDAFLKAYINIKNFKYESSFETWIFRIVSNTCLDEINRRKRLVTVSFEETSMEKRVTTQDIPEEEVEKLENRQEVLNALEKLSPEHKTVVILRDIQGFSYNEMEKILGCNIGTVKSRLKRARDKLRILLKKHQKTGTKS